MKKFSQLLAVKRKHGPNFDDYTKLVEIIEDNKNKTPDISIETCKTLLEGVSKTIILFLNKSENKNTLKKLDFQPLVKKAFETLSNYDPEFEVDFVRRIASLVQIMAELRNNRGEVSHGHVYPKDEESNDVFAVLVIDVSDALLSYMLTSLHNIDLEAYENIPYDKNPEFNEYLDELYPDIGIKYSQALYDQDYIQYTQRLFNMNSEEEKE